MVRFTGGLLLFTAYAAAVPAVSDQQQVIRRPSSETTQRKLQGRFLHITDVHPDPFYEPYTEPDGDHPCHHKGGKGSAGHFGAETTDCDTPFTLVNATFDWIDQNIKDDIDFVVWTGDSARHDNDEHYPRHNKQIIDLNKFVVDKFVQVFGKSGQIDPKNPLDSFVIPIVPTYGNNDILPHNIFTAGPNRWTRTFEDIWRGFVPQEQKHTFARGGWFFSEVIPNRLAVFSLNTLYFFDSNSAVDGCDAKSEPGYEHMEWLRIQLQFLRDRGMKAILIGHVPPARTDSKQNWDETCYQKYTLWLRQYRDVIIANIFGHMNVDHFMFQDASGLKYKFDIDGVDTALDRLVDFDNHTADPEFSMAGKTAYLSELHDSWAKLPKPPKGHSYAALGDAVDIAKKKRKEKELDKFLRSIGGPYGERFSLSLVSPSVVPNFFPTLRIVEYNITGLEHDHPAATIMGVPAEVYYERHSLPEDDSSREVEQQELRKRDHQQSGHDDDVNLEKKKKKRKKHHKKKRKPTFPVPEPPSKTAAPGPAYSPQSLSLLSWEQLYANLTKINAAYEEAKTVGHNSGHKNQQYVHFETEYTTKHDKYYKMKDLTVRSWLDLAERIGREELKHPQLQFDEEEEEDDDDEEIYDAELSRMDDSDLDDSLASDWAETFLDEVEIEISKRKDKKEKGKKKKGKKMKNHLWKEFLQRAFVQTKRDDELDDTFG
ncbi:uncharacterized protein HMPREF1541_08803 [Cyphellophora europaea CBS 101466]|uniref:Endopolyphosphatase n=1 Tax=Cyphellophora europaea (strain CBS 101466) TaxID=1220924 RepID=W2RJK4_CYPE1|nr:uncharacterized protein HMPREF1541_08803 [Cyphellophora europaea CBS 101466]ETN36525.1 hypothetical protein HMPREF1541_08803 [Cyphellophora europaea CBS 101466]